MNAITLRRTAVVLTVLISTAMLGPRVALAENGGDSLKAVASQAARSGAVAASTSTRIALRQPAREAVPTAAPPSMRWGSRGSDAWTHELLAAIDADGGRLVHSVPGDVMAYCPGYAEATAVQRRAFWAGLVSSIAKHESTWNPRAKGGGGRWLGLMQIAPSTWRAYGCSGEILNGGDNLSCAVRIMARQVGRDGVIAGGGARGVGRDWAPMRSAGKRADIASWTRQQSYCGV